MEPCPLHPIPGATAGVTDSSLGAGASGDQGASPLDGNTLAPTFQWRRPLWAGPASGGTATSRQPFTRERGCETASRVPYLGLSPTVFGLSGYGAHGTA